MPFGLRSACEQPAAPKAPKSADQFPWDSARAIRTHCAFREIADATALPSASAATSLLFAPPWTWACTPPPPAADTADRQSARMSVRANRSQTPPGIGRTSQPSCIPRGLRYNGAMNSNTSGTAPKAAICLMPKLAASSSAPSISHPRFCPADARQRKQQYSAAS